MAKITTAEQAVEEKGSVILRVSPYEFGVTTEACEKLCLLARQAFYNLTESKQ